MSEDLTDDEKNAAYTAKRTGETESPQEEEVKQNVLVPVEQQIHGINITGLKTLEQAIASEKSRPIQASDAMFFNGFDMYDYINYYKERGEIPHLKGTVLVDLGTGSIPFPYYLAQLGGAAGFVAVEPYNFQKLKDNFEPSGWDQEVALARKEKEGLEVQPPRIPASIVTEDMLTFLRRLPDHSVSLHVAGIDDAILPDIDYQEAVAREMKRVLSPSGVYIRGDNSVLMPHGLNETLDRFISKQAGGQEKKVSFQCYTLPENDQQESSDKSTQTQEQSYRPYTQPERQKPVEKPLTAEDKEKANIILESIRHANNESIASIPFVNLENRENITSAIVNEMRAAVTIEDFPQLKIVLESDSANETLRSICVFLLHPIRENSEVKEFVKSLWRDERIPTNIRTKAMFWTMD